MFYEVNNLISNVVYSILQPSVINIKIMKTLQALILHNESTEISIFENAVNEFDIAFEWIGNSEVAMDLMRNGKYSLLIIDKSLPESIIKQIDKLSETLFPEAATVTMFLNDREFIYFKMHQIMHNWNESQCEGGIQFYENPL